MILRNFSIPIETVDDLKNIVEKKRIILIYNYPNIHNGVSSIYLPSQQDICIINTSCCEGINRVIKSGRTVYNRNIYRGISDNLILPNGEINRNGEIRFLNGSYTYNVKKEKDPCKYNFSMCNTLMGCSNLEDELLRILNSDSALPFPQYYNIEDQFILGSTDSRYFDFMYNYSELPFYQLNQLIDKNTTIAKIEMNFDESILFNDDGKIQDTRNYSVFIGEIKNSLAKLYLKCYETILKSVFSQCTFIINCEPGVFNVPVETLRLKYNYKLSKEEITKEYARLVTELDLYLDNYCEELTQLEMIDTIYIHISNTISKIEFKKLNNKITSHSSSYSTSDTDELLLLFSSEGQLHPEYLSPNDDYDDEIICTTLPF